MRAWTGAWRVCGWGEAERSPFRLPWRESPITCQSAPGACRPPTNFGAPSPLLHMPPYTCYFGALSPILFFLQQHCVPGLLFSCTCIFDALVDFFFFRAATIYWFWLVTVCGGDRFGVFTAWRLLFRAAVRVVQLFVLWLSCRLLAPPLRGHHSERKYRDRFI